MNCTSQTGGACPIIFSNDQEYDICEGDSTVLNVDLYSYYTGCNDYSPSTETHIPDSSGDSLIIPFSISSAPMGVVDSTTQIEVCLNIEHSASGELEIALMSPDSTIVIIVDGYPGGVFPGGTSSGKTFLGRPIDNNVGSPGHCWQYCFKDNALNSAWSQGYTTTMVTTPSTGSSIVSGSYQPEESFNNFIGDSIDGTWNLLIWDNLSLDDGFLCSAELCIVDESTTIPFSGLWDSSDSSILSLSPTSAIASPTDTTLYEYVVFDSLNSCYDTTSIILNVLSAPTPNVSGPITTNHGVYQTYIVSGSSGSSYHWSCGDCSVISPNDTSQTWEVYWPAPFVGIDTLVLTETSANGCYASDTTFINVGYTKTPDIRFSETIIYPNPGKGLLKIRNEYDIQKITIISMTGKTIHMSHEKEIIDIHSFPAGIYWIRLDTRSGPVFLSYSKL